MIISNKRAFTLVEILIAAGVSVVFLGMAVTLFIGFSRSFSAGEGSAVLMQECALFTSRLRNDLNNAIMPQDRNFMTFVENQIKFNVYDSEDGVVKPVIYSAVRQSNGFYNITRKIANGAAHPIVKGKISSFNWSLIEDVIPTGATPVKRLGFELSLKMGSSDMKNKSFDFKTTIYPVRANKM